MNKAPDQLDDMLLRAYDDDNKARFLELAKRKIQRLKKQTARDNKIEPERVFAMIRRAEKIKQERHERKIFEGIFSK